MAQAKHVLLCELCVSAWESNLSLKISNETSLIGWNICSHAQRAVNGRYVNCLDLFICHRQPTGHNILFDCRLMADTAYNNPHRPVSAIHYAFIIENGTSESQISQFILFICIHRFLLPMHISNVADALRPRCRCASTALPMRISRAADAHRQIKTASENRETDGRFRKNGGNTMDGCQYTHTRVKIIRYIRESVVLFYGHGKSYAVSATNCHVDRALYIIGWQWQMKRENNIIVLFWIKDFSNHGWMPMSIIPDKAGQNSLASLIFRNVCNVS